MNVENVMSDQLPMWDKVVSEAGGYSLNGEFVQIAAPPPPPVDDDDLTDDDAHHEKDPGDADGVDANPNDDNGSGPNNVSAKDGLGDNGTEPRDGAGGPGGPHDEESVGNGGSKSRSPSASPRSRCVVSCSVC